MNTFARSGLGLAHELAERGRSNFAVMRLVPTESFHAAISSNAWSRNFCQVLLLIRIEHLT